jgi:quinol monooxygenase YgiN
MFLWLLHEDWQDKRKLKAHIQAVAGAQTAAAELAMQIQREQFEVSR